MFIYSMDGTNILNAQFPSIEGSNLWNFKDSNGTLITQEMNKILNQKNETFYEWYWKKSKDDNTTYKKIGFFKKFEPMDIFIGTGEYIDEFEQNLKDRILYKISKLEFDTANHLFIYTLDGTCLLSSKKELIGQNRINVKDNNGNYVVKEIIDFTTKNKEGFINYNSTIKLIDSLKSTDKISFVKLNDSLNLIIGSGFFTEELKNQIEKKKLELQESTNKTKDDIILYSFLITLFVLIFSLFLSKMIANMFIQYKLDIKKEIEKNFEKEKIMIQQSKMATMGEMIANIAHQWKQPLNLISVSNGVVKLNEELKGFVKEEDLKKSIENIDNSVIYLSNTIDDFRYFFAPDKIKNKFKVKDAISQTIKLISSQFKNNEIKIIENIDDLEAFGYKNELCQVLINIIKNAKDELIKLETGQKRLLFIDSYKEKENIVIALKDSAGGIPSASINKIFEAYFTTKNEEEGTGLGLYMSKQIIEGMDGKIEAINEIYTYENIEYKGALFKIIIPMKP